MLINEVLIKQAQEGNSRVRLEKTNKMLRNVKICYKMLKNVKKVKKCLNAKNVRKC